MSSSLWDPSIHRPIPAAVPSSYQEILSQTAHLLLQDGDPDTICQNVFNALREPFELDVYFHYLVSPDGTRLELTSSGGNEIARAALGTSLAFGEAVCGTVAQSCQAMYVTGVQQRNDPMTSLIRTFGIRCYACNPILVRGQIVGTLSFGTSQKDVFSAQELEFFRLVVRQVTLVTERRIQNERLRSIEQLAAAGRMSAALAHEINNPLDTLGNVLYQLRPELSGRALDLLDIAEAQVARLAETSHRTLALFRGKPQQPRLVSLSELTAEVAAEIRLPKNVHLHTELEPGLCVRLVPGEFRQVLFNLLINAAQFSPPGDPVTLTARRRGHHAELRVSDLGPGIAPEIRSRLFQPFCTTRTEGGTGLGLVLSREMIERIGGTLTFESDVAVRPGTDFIVTLPLAGEGAA